MPILHALIKLGRFMGLASLLMLTLATAGQAEYANPAIPGGDTAAHWLDQGGMLCTYGNFKGAVRAYEKALALSPNDSEIHFSLGVAYTQMGDYTNALAGIDKAISLAPENARYHYGRAWSLLLAGRAAEARPIFQRAAELGSADAQNYLQRQPTGP
jgi:Flp pilus assembly protein TadD